MLRIAYLLTFLLIISINLAYAQKPCRIHLMAKIVNTSDQSLEGVSISIKPLNVTALTDRKGFFSRKDICPGTYYIQLKHLGYQSIEKELLIRKDTSITLVMHVEEIHIQDIHVTGVQADHITSIRYVLPNKDKQERRGKLLADMLTPIAGVTQLRTGNNIAKPVINGLHSNRILILNNGVRQEGQQWGSEHAPELDPFTADRLEVIKGAQAVRYGADALGGVIISTPDPIDNDSLKGRVDLLGHSNGRGIIGNVRAEGGLSAIPNFGWRIQSSARKAGNTHTADYIMGNTGAQEFNFSTLFQYTHKKHWFEAFYSHFGTDIGVFYGAHVNTIEDIWAYISNGRPLSDYDFSYKIASPRQRVDHDLGKVKWNYVLSDQSKIEMQYSFQKNRRKEFDMRRSVADDVPMADMELSTQSLEISYKKDHYEFGANGMLQVNNNVPGTGTTPIIPNFDNRNLGVYMIAQHHWNKFHFEAGARYDYRYFDAAVYRYDYQNPNDNGSLNQYLYSGTRHFHNVSGSVGLLYHITPHLGVKNHVGLAWRAPSANELYSDGLHHGSGTYEVGNPHLNSEKGIKWVTSLIWTRDQIELTADVYGQYISGYIYAMPNPDSVRQTIRGTFPIFSYQANNALFYGTDISLTLKPLKSLNYTIKSSIVRAKNQDNRTYLPYIPTDRLQHSLQWNITPNGTYAKFSHQFVAEQRRYHIGTDYVAPPPSYHLMDLYLNTSFPIGKRKIEASLAIENIFNVLYKDYMDRFRYFSHQMGRNSTLGITYQF